VVEEYERVISELTQTHSELLRLNEEIRRRADTLELINRSLTETSRLGVVTLDVKGKVVAANETAGRLLHCSVEDKAGRPFEHLLGQSDKLAADVRKAFQDERAEDITNTAILRTGAATRSSGRRSRKSAIRNRG